MTPAAILRAAWALIEDPKNWTQDELARDARGEPIDPTSMYAVCWCAQGAFENATGTGATGEAWDLLCKAALEVEGTSAFYQINDCDGHAAVGRVYARAIQKAEEVG